MTSVAHMDIVILELGHAIVDVVGKSPHPSMPTSTWKDETLANNVNDCVTKPNVTMYMCATDVMTEHSDNVLVR